jgi:peroxiredoxin
MPRLTTATIYRSLLTLFPLVLISLLASTVAQDLNPVLVNAQDDGVYKEEVFKGKEALRRRDYEGALKSLKRANEMKQKRSAECYNLMSEAYFGLGAIKNVIECADKVIEIAPDDTQLVLLAYNIKGLALQSLAQNKDKKRLQEAEAAFRQGISLKKTQAILHFNLGVTLLQLSQDTDGIASLNQYIELLPRGSEVERARRLIDNPRRARENYAPDFSLTTSSGEHISLEDLKGRVVVLDFWGTWCPPCVESVPSLRTLNKRYSKEPSFMLIGISSDSDENEWREFTDKNKMIWPQYLDRDRRIQRAFGVRAFPTYILIDHEGIVRFQSVGSSWTKAANLDDAIRKQVKIVAKGVEVN